MYNRILTVCTVHVIKLFDIIISECGTPTPAILIRNIFYVAPRYTGALRFNPDLFVILIRRISVQIFQITLITQNKIRNSLISINDYGIFFHLNFKKKKNFQ